MKRRMKLAYLAFVANFLSLMFVGALAAHLLSFEHAMTTTPAIAVFGVVYIVAADSWIYEKSRARRSR